MAGELTPTMRMLRDHYVEAKAQQEESLDEYKRARESVDDLEAKWSRTYYSATLKAEGTVQERRAQAELEALSLKVALDAAKTIKASAEKAHRDATKRLEAITSMGHAYNRELKTFDG